MNFKSIAFFSMLTLTFSNVVLGDDATTMLGQLKNEYQKHAALYHDDGDDYNKTAKDDAIELVIISGQLLERFINGNSPKDIKHFISQDKETMKELIGQLMQALFDFSSKTKIDLSAALRSEMKHCEHEHKLNTHQS